MSIRNEDHSPSWLDEGNDESHKAEVSPLFGTGSLSLIDDEEERLIPYGGVESSSSVNYGAADDDEEEEEDINNRRIFQTDKKRASSIIITETGKPELPRKSFILASFQFIEGYGIITSLCMLATQVMPILLIPLKKLGVMSVVLKIYVSVFCFLFILVELNLQIPFLKNATFLQTYISRGFLYSFIALSCLEEAYSERVKDMVAHARDQFHVAWFSLFMQVSSWMMLSLGIVYMLLGVCCLRKLRNKVAENEKERWKAYKEAIKSYRESNP